MPGKAGKLERRRRARARKRVKTKVFRLEEKRDKLLKKIERAKEEDLERRRRLFQGQKSYDDGPVHQCRRFINLEREREKKKEVAERLRAMEAQETCDQESSETDSSTLEISDAEDQPTSSTSFSRGEADLIGVAIARSKLSQQMVEPVEARPASSLLTDPCPRRDPPRSLTQGAVDCRTPQERRERYQAIPGVRIRTKGAQRDRSLDGPDEDTRSVASVDSSLEPYTLELHPQTWDQDFGQYL